VATVPSTKATQERAARLVNIVCIVAANSSHRAELDEALGLAAHRWEQLLSMESQVQGEEQQLAARPKSRPPQPGDDTLPDRTIEKQAREWVDATKHRRESLAALRDQARAERQELEGYMAGRR
jgi:hypothetical protein